MRLTDLGNPKPRSSPLTYQEHRYNTLAPRYLSPPGVRRADFFEVAAQRSSRRSFGPIGPDELSALLWYSAKRRDARMEDGRAVWQHAPTPSAGGCHPIDLLITHVGEEEEIISLYDPIEHSLCEMIGLNPEPLKGLAMERQQVLAAEPGTAVLWFAAQPARTLSRYFEGDSLVWRDSGVLLATIGLTAEALGLKCCALGITGEPWISGAMCPTNFVVGVGGCLIGN